MSPLANPTFVLARDLGLRHTGHGRCRGGSSDVAVPPPTGGTSVGTLFETIRALVSRERYVVGQHASERLETRGIVEWQVVAGLDDGQLISERPNAIPNPAVEVRERLPDGTEIKAVGSHLRASAIAKLVTVHFFDGDRS